MFVLFSSRSRHTRFDCDWSSDVCSSDLERTLQHVSPCGDSLWVRSIYPGCGCSLQRTYRHPDRAKARNGGKQHHGRSEWRSEEHTSELQSQSNLVCRLLLEQKNTLTERS